MNENIHILAVVRKKKIILSKVRKTNETLKTFSDRLRLAYLAPKIIGKGTKILLFNILFQGTGIFYSQTCI